MNIYFDTEFTGLVPNTTLISLGCVAETGEKFYAEFTDYNKDLCDDWIKENVIANLMFPENSKNGIIRETEDYKEHYISWDTEHVRKCFTEWLEHLYEEHGERIQFISDVCHYDFYLLCNLFGGAFSLPENVNPVCYDLWNDIFEWLYMNDMNDGWKDMESPEDIMYEAFNYSREELCKDLTESLPEGKKHNALYDAMVIKAIYEGFRDRKVD